MEHSEFSPSRLHRIINCPGSVRLIAACGILPEPSIHAQKGTELHDYTYKYLTGNPETIKELELEDQNLVLDCVDYFNNVLRTKDTHLVHKFFEKSISLESWGLPEVWGTSDAGIIDMTAMHLDIFDWKFGSGVQVFAKENPQQMAYAAGAIKWPNEFSIFDVTIHIVQPPFDHYDTWDITVNDLFKWVHSKLAAAIYKSRLDPPIFIPGEEQCRFCDAAKLARCPFRHAKAQADAVKIFENAKLKAILTPKQIQEYLDLFPLVEQVAKGYIKFIQEELERGNEEFDQYKLVRGRSNRSWIDEANVIKWLSENSNIEDVFESKLKSPSKLEKEDRTLKTNVNFQKLYEKPEGSLKLAKITDKRPAVVINKTAIDAFKDIPFPDKLE